LSDSEFEVGLPQFVGARKCKKSTFVDEGNVWELGFLFVFEIANPSFYGVRIAKTFFFKDWLL
jgi:hypothetical protein